MSQITKKQLCNGVQLQSIQNKRFKTMRISVYFMVPMNKNSAAANALLSALLTRSCKDYPDFTKLSERLSELYGASLSGNTAKIGDNQVIAITASSIADDYCFDGESVSAELTRLICQMLFEPPFDENGNFKADDFNQEKRQLLESIDAEYNDKRVYAKSRCEEIMCDGEPYGISRFGDRSDVEKLTPEQLKSAWQELIKSARVEAMVLGNCSTESVSDVITEEFAKAKRDSVCDCKTAVILKAEEVKEVVEKQPVAQSKLVLGFRTGTLPDTDDEMATRVMVMLYGGTPSSKLFLNVREKLSLCYYCSAGYIASKGIMLVQSGVETKNIEAAKKEILAQLEEVKKGNFTDEDILFTKLSLCNSYNSVEDYLSGIEQWYIAQTFRKECTTPQQSAEEAMAITREQIIEAANRITLDTVYILEGEGHDEQ